MSEISLGPNHSIILIPNMYEKQSRNTSRSADTVASFLLKTYQILEHPQYQRMISWDKGSVGFIIHDVLLFTRQVLPKYFRHSNFSSFVRQLNMYDFHKVKQQNESLVFKNPLFCKGEQHNLKLIRRKAAKKVGGQRKQYLSEKSDLQNQKYQNLLKGFKKSIESEINQSSLFYEKSIHMMKDLNESNQKKLHYIGNLYVNDQKTDTTQQIKYIRNQGIEKNGIQQEEAGKKDTILQIPRQFIGPEKDAVVGEVQQSKKLNKVENRYEQPKKTLNLDNMMVLKEQIYRSLGIYQNWLNDYIQAQKKKIKYVNGCRSQLLKCRQTKIYEDKQEQADGQINWQNKQNQQQVELYREQNRYGGPRIQKRISIEIDNQNMEVEVSFNQKQSESPICKLQKKDYLPPLKLFQAFNQHQYLIQSKKQDSLVIKRKNQNQQNKI